MTACRPISHLPEGQANTEEVAFYQMIRKQLRKLTPAVHRSVEDLERAVQDLLDESIQAQPAVDIFAVAGLEKPDISILDEVFLAGFGGPEHPDLQTRPQMSWQSWSRCAGNSAKMNAENAISG